MNQKTLDDIRMDIAWAADSEAEAKKEYQDARMFTQALRWQLYLTKQKDLDLTYATRTTDDAWRSFLHTYNLPDTPTHRLIFCLGTRHGIVRATTTIDDGQAMLRLSDELEAFGPAATFGAVA